MALEYTLRVSDGELDCCDSCDSAAPTAEFDWGPPYTAKHDKPHRLLCEFCSTTMASRYTEYPTYDEQGWLRAEIWRAAASVFNKLKHGDPTYSRDTPPPGGEG